jgi:hypothetical protein
MEKNKALKMIDEYLQEPNSIHPDWIDALLYCRECIKKLDELKEENELLRNAVEELRK